MTIGACEKKLVSYDMSEDKYQTYEYLFDKYRPIESKLYISIANTRTILKNNVIEFVYVLNNGLFDSRN
jgi:predicted nucleic-acid-binding protein